MPSIRVVHQRELAASPAEVGRLLDSLASDDDRVWPVPRWPAVRFDRPLGVGARGGHGPIRYEVCEYDPGRRVRFRFDPRMFIGYHQLEVSGEDGRATLAHVVEGEPRGWLRLAWPAAIRYLHDAAVEDCLDRVESQLHGIAWHPRALSGWVQVLRAVGLVGLRGRGEHARSERRRIAPTAMQN